MLTDDFVTFLAGVGVVVAGRDAERDKTAAQRAAETAQGYAKDPG